MDESYFGGKKKDKRGRYAVGEISIFEILKCVDKVYTQIVNNCIIASKADKNSVLYTDCFRVYDGFVDYGYKQHYRVKHSANQFADGHNHINRIENFWGLCKVRLAKLEV